MSTSLEEDVFLSEESFATYNDKKRRLDDLFNYLQDLYNTIFDKSLYSLEMLKEWVSVYQRLIQPNIIV